MAEMPLDPRYYLLYALVLDEQGESEAAAEWLRRTLYLEPGSVMAHVALGDLAARAREPDTSRRHYRNALAALAARPAGEPVAEGDGLSAATLAGWLHGAARECAE